MNISEILITGYDGDTGVFATNVSRARAQTILFVTGTDGQPTVDCVLDAGAAFDKLLEVLNEPGVVAAAKP